MSGTLSLNVIMNDLNVMVILDGRIAEWWVFFRAVKWNIPSKRPLLMWLIRAKVNLNRVDFFYRGRKRQTTDKVRLQSSVARKVSALYKHI